MRARDESVVAGGTSGELDSAGPLTRQRADVVPTADAGAVCGCVVDGRAGRPGGGREASLAVASSSGPRGDARATRVAGTAGSIAAPRRRPARGTDGYCRTVDGKVPARSARVDHEGAVQPRVHAHGLIARHVDVAAAEVTAWQDGPRVPRIVASSAVGVHREAENRPVVPAERAPADIAGRIAPRHPRRPPRAAGNPEPGPGRRSPSAVVMRRPCPGIVGNPRPAVGRQARPAAVVVRTPADLRRAGTTRSRTTARAARSRTVEGRRIRPHVFGQVLRGDCRAAVAARSRTSGRMRPTPPSCRRRRTTAPPAPVRTPARRRGASLRPSSLRSSAPPRSTTSSTSSAAQAGTTRYSPGFLICTHAGGRVDAIGDVARRPRNVSRTRPSSNRITSSDWKSTIVCSSRCRALPSANSTSTRPSSVRSRSPASSGIESRRGSGRPSRSSDAVPSTTEMCAGGSAAGCLGGAGSCANTGSSPETHQQGAENAKPGGGSWGTSEGQSSRNQRSAEAGWRWRV